MWVTRPDFGKEWRPKKKNQMPDAPERGDQIMPRFGEESEENPPGPGRVLNADFHVRRGGRAPEFSATSPCRSPSDSAQQIQCATPARQKLWKRSINRQIV